MRIRSGDKLLVVKRRENGVRIPAKQISGPVDQIEEDCVKSGRVDHIKHSIES